MLTPEEYEQKSEEFHDLAHRAGVIYARIRKFKSYEPYAAPDIVIRHEQTRLDRFADRISVLQVELVDYDMEHDDA